MKTNTNDGDTGAQVIRSSDLLCGLDYAPHDSTMPAAAIKPYQTGKIRTRRDSILLAICIQSFGDSASTAAAPTPTGNTAAAV